MDFQGKAEGLFISFQQLKIVYCLLDNRKPFVLLGQKKTLWLLLNLLFRQYLTCVYCFQHNRDQIVWFCNLFLEQKKGTVCGFSI